MKKLAALSIVAVVLVSACSKAPSEPAPTGTSTSTSTSTSTAIAASGSTPSSASGTLTWDAPAGWTPVANPSPMRKATFKVDDTEATITSAGGTVESNWKRWQDQFGGATPKIEKKKVNNLDVTIVELKGTFNGGMMGGKTGAGQAMLGAIIETMPDLTFFKLVGSEATIAKNKDAFDKLVASARIK